MGSKELAKVLYEAINAVDVEGFSKATDYSGRAMYGARCVGVVVDNPGKLMLLGAELERMEQSVEPFLRPRTDNMGYDLIVYWPNYDWDSSFMSDPDAAVEDDDE